MHKFAYAAKQGPALLRKGEVSAQDVCDAVEQLRRLGLTAIDIKAARPSKSEVWSLWRPRRRHDAAGIMRQLAYLTQGDVPTLNALRMLGRRSENKGLLQIVNHMVMRMEEGALLSNVLSDHCHLFPLRYVHMIKSGELSGRVGEVLEKAADHMDEELNHAARIQGALYYPIFVFGVSLLTIVVMLTFVVPKMASLYNEFQSSLPLPTKILLSVSRCVQQNGWIGLLLAAGLMASARWAMRPGELQTSIDRRLLRLRMIGELIAKIEAGRILRTLSLLLHSGVDMMTALETAEEVAVNSVIKMRFHKMTEEVASGADLSTAMTLHHVFDEAVISMIRIGEESGDLPRSLEQIAVMHDREIKRTTDVWLSLLGPSLLVVVVGFTGFVVAALLLPIMQMDILVR